jgi:hypothetical protein
MICGLELPDEYTYASTGEAVKLPSLIQPVPAAEEDAEAAAGMPSSKAEKASNVITRQGIIRNFTLDPSRSCRHLYPSPTPSGSARYRAVTSVWPLAIWVMRATAGQRGAVFTIKVKLPKHNPDDPEPGRMRDPGNGACASIDYSTAGIAAAGALGTESTAQIWSANARRSRHQSRRRQ